MYYTKTAVLMRGTQKHMNEMNEGRSKGSSMSIKITQLTSMYSYDN